MRAVKLGLIALVLFGVLGALFFPIFARQGGKSPDAPTMRNLHSLSLALLMYCDDYQVFPPMQDAITTFNYLGPYFGAPGNENLEKSPLFDPVGGKPFQPNPMLSGKRRKDIPDTAIAFYSTTKNRFDHRPTVTVGGNVKLLTDREWATRKRELTGN